MSKLILIVGEQGTGKTDTANALTANMEGTLSGRPFDHIVYADKKGQPARAVRLGNKRHPNFGGTDQLRRRTAKEIPGWLATKNPAKVAVADTNNWATQDFIDKTRAAGNTVHVVRLTTKTEGERTARVTKRERDAKAAGVTARRWTQKPRYQKKMRTQLDNLEQNVKGVIRIETTGLTPAQIAKQVAVKTDTRGVFRL